MEITFLKKMRNRKFSILMLLAFISCQSKIELPDDVALAYEKLPEVIDYNYHIKPILSENCFQCHGPDKANQKADLRLDIADSAYKELPNSPGKYAIVRKKPGASEVVQRILSDDPEYAMPVLESHLKLNAHEKASIVKWIRQGAKYKKHWAYISPQLTELPEVENESIVQNEIDPFILKKLEVQGLKPAEKADKEILFRRLSFALRGLPPSIKETDDFLADPDPGNYEQ